MFGDTDTEHRHEHDADRVEVHEVRHQCGKPFREWFAREQVVNDQRLVGPWIDRTERDV